MAEHFQCFLTLLCCLGVETLPMGVRVTEFPHFLASNFTKGSPESQGCLKKKPGGSYKTPKKSDACFPSRGLLFLSDTPTLLDQDPIEPKKMSQKGFYDLQEEAL